MSKEVNEELQPRRWLLVVLIIIAIVISVVLINKIVMDKKAEKNEEGGIFDIFKDTTSKINTSSFNSDFEMYKGTEYGSSVSRLLDEVITNNKKNKDRLVKVVYEDTETTDPTEIKNLKKKFDTWDKLEVSLDYDDEGFIYLITIENYDTQAVDEDNSGIESDVVNNSGNSEVSTSVIDNNDDFEKTSFNSFATFHSGTKSGFFVKSMIDYVINNNGSNPEHILFVSYKNTNTTDVSALKKLKENFADFTDYEVTVSYAADGYASGFNVN